MTQYLTASDDPSEPRRLHPITPLFDLIAGSRQLLIPVFAGATAGGDRGRLLFMVPLVVFLAAQAVRWLRFSYWIDAGSLHVQQGLFVRRHRVIPLESIQQVDVTTKLRHRALGVVTLVVETGVGESGGDLKLDVITVQEASRLRPLLDPRRRTSHAVGDADAPAAGAGPEGDELVRLSFAQVALAGVTGSRAALVLAGLATLDEVVEPLFDRIRGALPDDVRPGAGSIAGGLVLGLVVWFAVAAVMAVFADGNYSLRRVAQTLTVRRGLLDQRELSTSIDRVQTVVVQQNPVRRLLGLVSLRAHTAATPGQTVGRLSVPILPEHALKAVVCELLPRLPDAPAFTPAPLPALRRAVIRRVVPFTVLATPAAAFVRPVEAALASVLLVAVVAALAGCAHWTAWGVAWRDGVLWVRRGSVLRETVIVRADRTQSLHLSTTPLQRRVGLADLEIRIAGEGSTTTVGDGDEVWLARLLDVVPAVAAADERRVRAATATATASG